MATVDQDVDSRCDYDVALSFLAVDEPLATAVHGLLTSSLKVFVYSRSQEDIVGRDGYEKFSSVFQLQSRIVVVLHRSGWGASPFTSVEEHAIKSRHFGGEFSWDYLLAVKCDDALLPPWIPPYRMYHRIAGDSATVLAGHISNLAVQHGSRPREERAVDVLQRRLDARAREEETQSWLRTGDGKKKAEGAAAGFLKVLRKMLESVPEAEADVHIDGSTCRLEFENVALSLWLRHSNSEHPYPALIVTRFDGPFRTNVRGNRVRDVREPRNVGANEYRLTLTDGDADFVWVPDEQPEARLTDLELSDRILRLLLQHADKNK